jgi:hypothetical protein
VTDDLTPPPSGSGRIRLVQGSGSPTPVVITGPNGLTVAKDANYGTTTPYANVPEGRWPLRLSAGAAPPASADIRADSSNTLLDTENPRGGVQSRSIADSATLAGPSKLGVENGAVVPR